MASRTIMLAMCLGQALAMKNDGAGDDQSNKFPSIFGTGAGKQDSKYPSLSVPGSTDQGSKYPSFGMNYEQQQRDRLDGKTGYPNVGAQHGSNNFADSFHKLSMAGQHQPEGPSGLLSYSDDNNRAKLPGFNVQDGRGSKYKGAVLGLHQDSMNRLENQQDEEMKDLRRAPKKSKSEQQAAIEDMEQRHKEERTTKDQDHDHETGTVNEWQAKMLDKARANPGLHISDRPRGMSHDRFAAMLKHKDTTPKPFPAAKPGVMKMFSKGSKEPADTPENNKAHRVMQYIRQDSLANMRARQGKETKAALPGDRAELQKQHLVEERQHHSRYDREFKRLGEKGEEGLSLENRQRLHFLPNVKGEEAATANQLQKVKDDKAREKQSKLDAAHNERIQAKIKAMNEKIRG